MGNTVGLRSWPGWVLAGAMTVGMAAPARAQLLVAGGGWLEESSYLYASYHGTWHPIISERYSGMTATQSTEPGATVRVAFNGTGIRWIGFRDEWSGIAAVFIDGEFRTTVDTYSSPALHRTVVFETNELEEGTHSLIVQVLDTHNAASAASWVWIDAFEVLTDGTATPPLDPWPGSLRTEEDDPAVGYAGTWFESTSSHHSGGRATLALDAGARATFSFTGTGVRWIGYRDEWSGIGRVYLDGSLVAYVDLYAPSFEAQAVLFSAPHLSAGPHSVAVEATHDRNPDANQRWVWLDAFDFVP